MAVQHVFTNPVADGTNTTGIVVPSHWNSQHNQVMYIGGNTVGVSSATGTDIQFQGGNNVTLSVNQGAGVATIVISGANTVAQSVQTQASGNIAGAGYTSTTQAGTSIGITHNSAGLSLAQPPFITTYAAQTVQPVAVSAAGGSSLFSTLNIGTTGAAANGVTFTNSGGSVLMSHSLQQLSNTTAITANAVNTSVSASFFLTANSSNLVALSNSSLFELSAGQTNYLQWGNSSTSYAGTNATITMASNGLSISAGGGGVVNQTGPNIAVAGQTVTAGTVYFSNSPTVTFGMDGASNITASAAGGGGGAAVTYLTYQNRQLGASSTTSGQGTFWFAPMRNANYLNASSLMQMFSASGASTSNSGAVGITYQAMMYAQTATNSTDRFDSIWSGQYLMTFANSSSTSIGVTVNGGANGQNLTTASAASNILTLMYGVRLLTFNVGSTLTPGLYGFGFLVSTSGATSAPMSIFRNIVDNPLASAGAMGFNIVTNASIGYVDGGKYTTTTASCPTTVYLSQVVQSNNVMPYVKIGAI